MGRLAGAATVGTGRMIGSGLASVGSAAAGMITSALSFNNTSYHPQLNFAPGTGTLLSTSSH